MGYAMKGAPTHYGTSKHKSALKQLSKEEEYTKIIKDNKMTKDDKGIWKDSKNRSVSQIHHNVKREQGSHNTNIKKI